MSLSGRLPTSVTSLSSRNLLPAFGPRRTTSNAVFGGSESSATSADDSSPTSTSAASAAVKIMEVVSVAVARSAALLVSGVPHCEQKRKLSELGSPQVGHTTLGI